MEESLGLKFAIENQCLVVDVAAMTRPPLNHRPRLILLSSSQENDASRRLLSLAVQEHGPISSFTDMANRGEICICACSDVSAEFRRIVSRADMKSQSWHEIATIRRIRFHPFKATQAIPNG